MASQRGAPSTSARSPSLLIPTAVFLHGRVDQAPVLQLHFVQQRGDSISLCSGTAGACAGRVQWRSWDMAKVSVASHLTPGRASSHSLLSLQPPSPPAPAPTAAPGGRITCTSFALTEIPLKEFLQTEFVMHFWEHFFSTVISPNEIPGHF